MSYPRIKFNGINFDWQARPNSFQALREKDFRDFQPSGGTGERLTFKDQWVIQCGRNFFENADIEQLKAFFDYADDGYSFEFWRDRAFGDALGFENTLYTANEKAISTFARASAGYRLNPATGFYESIATNLPRYVAGRNGIGHGLLLEKAATNRCQHANAFGSWVAVNCTVTSNITTVTDIFGTNIADLLAISATNGGVFLTTGFTPPTTTTPFTFSVFLRTASGTADVFLIIGQNSVSLTTKNCTVTSEWQRFDVTFSGTVSTSFAIELGIASVAGAMNIYACQAQGENNYFASGIIPTSGSEVTRSADRAEWTATDFLDTVNLQITIAFWIKPTFAYNDGSDRLFFVVDGVVTAGYCIYLAINSSNNWLLSARDIGNTERVAGGSSASALTQNAWNRVVAVIDSTISNGMTIYVNGTAVQTSSISAFALSPLSASPKIGVGGDTGTTCTAPGVYDDFRVDKTAWTAAQVADDYASRDTSVARRNYWSALRLRQPNFVPEERIGSNLFSLPLEFEEVLS